MATENHTDTSCTVVAVAVGVLGLLCGPQAAGQAGKALGAEDAAAFGAGVLGGGSVQRGDTAPGPAGRPCPRAGGRRR